MRSARPWVALGSAGLAMAATVAMGIPTASAAGSTNRSAIAGSLSPAATRYKTSGTVAAASKINFDLTLALRHASAARAFVRQVSSPGSATYHHYLTDAQWVNRYAPSLAQVHSAQAWLRKQGFKVGATPKTRLFVSASGSARQVERAFSTGLAMYKVNGHKVRLATRSLSVPTSIAGAVSGVVGVNQYVGDDLAGSPGEGDAPERRAG